jgi:hypothetical protein
MPRAYRHFLPITCGTSLTAATKRRSRLSLRTIVAAGLRAERDEIAPAKKEVKH